MPWRVAPATSREDAPGVGSGRSCWSRGLDSLLVAPSGGGGRLGRADGAGGVPAAGCDGAVTRVIVTRRPAPQAAIPTIQPWARPEVPPLCPGSPHQGWREAAAATALSPDPGGAPTQPLEVGRTTRVIQPAQRSALAVRDGGCVFPHCTRPLAWCDAHHLRHWLHGGPTDLANLALLCRAHHRAIHEGGWRLVRGPDGRWTATPPYRRHPTARRHPSAA